MRIIVILQDFKLRIKIPDNLEYSNIAEDRKSFKSLKIPAVFLRKNNMSVYFNQKLGFRTEFWPRERELWFFTFNMYKRFGSEYLMYWKIIYIFYIL